MCFLSITYLCSQDIEIDYNQFKAHNKVKIARETAKKVARVKTIVVVVMLVNLMRRSVRRA